METTTLTAAVAELEKARVAIDEQSTKLAEFERKLGPADAALKEADEHLAQIQGAALLGEALPTAVDAAREKRTAARDAAAAIVAAIKVLRGRCETAGAAVREAQTKAEIAVRPVAAELAAEKRRHVHALAAALETACRELYEIDGAASGGFRQGASQTRVWGITEVWTWLRGAEYIQGGHPEGRGKLPTPREILTLANPKKGKAA